MTTIKNYIFYKICCDDYDEIYVGSTCNFNNRKRQHKQNVNLDNERNNLKIYKTIRENGGWDNWRMIQIGSRDGITKRDAEKIEEEYRVELRATLNDKFAFVDKKSVEYKNRKAEWDKKWRESEKGKQVTERRKDYFNNYNQDQETKDRKHQWYLDNKEKLIEKAQQKFICSCGKEVSFVKKARHEKTQFHINHN